MKKIEAYRSALKLYANIFSKLQARYGRFFMATIKYELVYFFYALIWNAANSRGLPKRPFRTGKHIFPRNVMTWKFGSRYLICGELDCVSSSADQDYFLQLARQTQSRADTGKKLAVLSYGLDLGRLFTLQDLQRGKDIGVVIDWQLGPKTESPCRVIKRRQAFADFRFYYFFLLNLQALCRIYSLIRPIETNIGIADFLRYFLYHAFESARVRSFLHLISRDRSIGEVIFSDLDNVLGNSMRMWSEYYGFSQISYPHGSSLYFNKDRYFSPKTAYVHTIYHEQALRMQPGLGEIIITPPLWLRSAGPAEDLIVKGKVENIVLFTTMKRNLEIGFAEKTVLLDYLESLSKFAGSRGISFAIKSHPLLDWHREYDEFARQSECLEHFSDRWETKDFSQVGLAILANPETTATLQLLYCGVPVITCSELVPEIWKAHFSVPDFQFVATTKKELFGLLERLLEDRKFYQQSKIQAGSIFRHVMKL